MSAPEREPPKTISRGLAYILFAIVWVVLPWTLSLLMRRYGWTAGRPGLWNDFGLIPVVVGLTGSLWTLHLHFAQSHDRLDWELDKNYLLTRGAYSFSRNPMYLFELILIFGWAIFYGSIPVLIAFLFWWSAFTFYIIPQEERVIESHFGEAYRDYKRSVRRWIGRVRR
jgi:protein-S-isoprenylcysteine O-methyltransferase Ste14